MVRNKSSVFANIGATSHSSYEREKNDVIVNNDWEVLVLQALGWDYNLWNVLLLDVLWIVFVIVVINVVGIIGIYFKWW